LIVLFDYLMSFSFALVALFVLKRGK